MTVSKLLRIYLNDHLAGSVAGSELARRCLANNEGTQWEDRIAWLVAEIEADQAELERLMDALAVPKDTPKQAAAWVAEKLGRLKLNGQLVGYSDLSRVIELETLVMGVHGKQCLWESLIQIQEQVPATGVDLEKLRDSARHQWSVVNELRLEAASVALGQTESDIAR